MTYDCRPRVTAKTLAARERQAAFTRTDDRYSSMGESGQSVSESVGLSKYQPSIFLPTGPDTIKNT